MRSPSSTRAAAAAELDIVTAHQPPPATAAAGSDSAGLTHEVRSLMAAHTAYRVADIDIVGHVTRREFAGLRLT